MSSILDNYSTSYNISYIDKSKKNILPNLYNSLIYVSKNLKNQKVISNLLPTKNNNKSIKLNVFDNNNYQKTIKSFHTIETNNEHMMFKLRLKRAKTNLTKFKNENENTKKKKKEIKSVSFTKKEINLLNNPESYFDYLFQSSKDLDNKLKMKQKKTTFKKKITDIKKGFQNKEDNVFKQLFLLKKDIRDDDEEKFKGKIISTKTFLDLKIKEILYN